MNEEETKRYMIRLMREYGVSRTDIGNTIKTTRQYVGLLVSGKRKLSNKMLSRLDEVYPPKEKVSNSDVVSIQYENTSEYFYIDNKFFANIEVNKKHCFIHRVSGNSMSPVYNDGDKVIVDSSMKSFIDGHIFLFTDGKNSFMRLVNVLPDQVKCIAYNHECDTFYINPNSGSIKIRGLVVPRIRL